MITVIDGKLFSKMFISAANNLENHKAAVNDMNVFPVPDGDTGTNMALTVKAAAGELLKYPDGGVSGLADCVAKASLRGTVRCDSLLYTTEKYNCHNCIIHQFAIVFNHFLDML